jgi:hypothetical protein
MISWDQEAATQGALLTNLLNVKSSHVNLAYNDFAL